MYRSFFSLAALLAAAASAQEMMNLTAALSGAPDLSNLTTLVSANRQLLSALSQASNITILAPSNEAFAKIAQSETGMAVTMNNTLAIQALLQYHVLNGTYSAAQIMETSAFVPTLLTDETYTNVTGGQVVQAVKIGEEVTLFSGLQANSTVTQADMNFTGGVIHVIDSLLSLPLNISTTATQAGLSGLVGLLEQTDLASDVDTAMDLTVFAPNNEAFQKIGSALPNLTTTQVASILGYHVVNGTVAYSSTLENGTTVQTMGGGNLTITVEDEAIFVNSARVVMSDVLVANGVVHVIDNVLNPNATTVTPDATASSQPVAYSGASSASDLPFTSDVPTPTTTLGGGLAGATSSMTAEATVMETSTSTGVAAAVAPMKTGAVGAAALFAGAMAGGWLNV